MKQTDPYLILQNEEPSTNMPSPGFLRIILLLWTTFAVYANKNFEEKCLSFEPEAYVQNSTRQVLAYIAAGTNLTFPDNVPSCNRTSQVVAKSLCRVALSIPTSKISSISFELWLPEDWSGRFLATGNGGVDGCK